MKTSRARLALITLIGLLALTGYFTTGCSTARTAWNAISKTVDDALAKGESVQTNAVNSVTGASK